MINKNVWGVVSCPKIEVTFSLKRIKLAGKSVRPSAVGESALGGKFVQILHRDHSVRFLLLLLSLNIFIYILIWIPNS